MRSASTSRPSRRRAQPGRGRAGGGQQVAQRPPLGVPRAGGALVLLHHRGEQRRDEPGRLLRAAERGDRGDRVVLVRHRATSRRRRASRTSPTSVCASSDDVARDLADRARGDAERAGELADPAAQRVPGEQRRVEPEVARARRRARRPVAPSAASVPTGAAELRRRAARARSARRRASSSPTIQPAAFSPNVVGSACCSSVRPMIGVSRCVVGQLRRGVGRAAQVVEQRHAARAWATSIAAVSTTSWLVAPWCTGRVGCGLAAPSRPRPPGCRSPPRRRRSRRRRSGRRRRPRRSPPPARAVITPARACARASAGLDVEHRLQPGAAGDLLGDAAAREHAARRASDARRRRSHPRPAA